LPPVVPAPLAAVADLLQCPVCEGGLAPVPGGLACARGHHHDLAREGYVALLNGPVGRAAGDDAAMVAARVEIEAAGHFAPLTTAIVAAVGAAEDQAAAPGGTADEPHAPDRAGEVAPTAGGRRDERSLAIDIGAGTGRHLAAVVERSSRPRHGVAIDVSRAACRSIARAHPPLAVVRADVWSRIPVADGAADLVLDVFAPRNGAELARVVEPGGILLVATPAAGHLGELRELHRLSIQPDKPARLREQLRPWFEEATTEAIEWSLSLTAAEATNLLRMGPSARHLRPGALEELARSVEPVRVTAAVEIATFRRVATTEEIDSRD
jgi:23S rRNA (guanine745-N1)-methyltransferase